MDVQINPAESTEIYLGGLNDCFPHWGGMEMYDWCFTRDAGAGRADLMILRVKGELAAGSGVVYRPVKVGGARHTVGIMCGSWTLPPARRQGCFTRVIEESLALCRQRNVDWLIAFVTENNPSRRRLEAAGARMIPTTYCVGAPEPRRDPVLEVREVDASLESFAESLERFERRRTSRARFHYPEVDHLYRQMAGRVLTTSCLEIGDRGFAVVERAEDTDRLLMLGTIEGGAEARGPCVEALAHQAALTGKKLFFFASTPGDRAFAEALGLTIIEGFLTVIPSGMEKAAALPADWFIESGDRM